MILAGCLWDTRERWNGTVRILHQPAEEMPSGGARAMIADGALQGIDYVLGCHVMNQLEFGGVFYHCGATQQARAKFTIQIQGKGGHGSSPHEANDAIVIAGHLVIALQTIVSRRISPMESGVVTIGSFDGKGEFNSIKDRVILEGDVRCMAESTRKKIEEEIKRIAFGTARTYGCDITVQYQNDYPVLWNDPSLTKRVVREWKKAGIAPVTDCGPLNPSEDFSYYSQQVPSCFFYIGAQPAGKAYPHHHPKFDIREEAMMKAARAMTVATLTCLAEKEMR